MQLADIEKGLYQENHKCIKKIEYKINYCTRCISFLKLIFLLEIMLFLGWGCYMILQNYSADVMKNDEATLEKYSMIESLSETQKSRPNTETPSIFVSNKDIIDRTINFLKGMKFTEDQNLMQNKIAVTNVSSMVQTNMQNSSNVQSNNTMEISGFNRSSILYGNSVHDEQFRKNPIEDLPQHIDSVEFIDKDTNIDKDEDSLHMQFISERLRNISKTEIMNDLEKFENRNDFIEDVNDLMLKNQDDHVSNAPDNLENVATTLDPENSKDYTISIDLLRSIALLDRKQESFDLTKDSVQDHNKNSFLFDENDEQIKSDSLKPIPVIFYELPLLPKFNFTIDLQPHDFAQLEQKLLEKIKTGSNYAIDESNEDNMNNSDMSISENQDHSDVSTVTAQNTEQQQYLSESTTKIKEDENSMEHTNNFIKWLLQQTVLDSVESSTPKVDDSVEATTPKVDEFQWFNGPPTFVDLRSEDISKSSEMLGSLRDTYEDMNVDDIVPGSQCEITVKMGILQVKCPNIKFDEGWNVTSSEVLPIDVPNDTFEDIFENIFGSKHLNTKNDEDENKKLEVENISNESSDKKVISVWDMFETNTETELKQESTTTNAKVSNDELLDLSDAAAIEPFDIGESSRDYPFYDSSYYDVPYRSTEEEVKQVTTSSSISEFDFSTTDSHKERNPFVDLSTSTLTQPDEQLKISKEQDYSVSDNTETSLKDFEHFYEKKLTSIFINEMLNFMAPHLRKIHNSKNNIYNTFDNIRSISEYPEYPLERYITLKKLLENIENSDYPHSTDDFDHRKKRMIADDLMWQQDQVSNKLEEDDQDVDSLESLKKIFQRMEILALCIDRLHERYLLHNKLDDDYASSEFPIEKHRELYTSKIIYEK